MAYMYCRDCDYPIDDPSPAEIVREEVNCMACNTVHHLHDKELLIDLIDSMLERIQQLENQCNDWHN